MILYNVTVNIEKEVENEWLSWMKAEHIPDVLATGAFVDYKFYKILHNPDESTVNYSVQYFSETMEKLMHYSKHDAPKLQNDVKVKFQEKLVSFRTVLEQVE